AHARAGMVDAAGGGTHRDRPRCVGHRQPRPVGAPAHLDHRDLGDLQGRGRSHGQLRIPPPQEGARRVSATDAPTEPAAPPRAKRWQKVTSVVLLVIGFILIPLSAVAIWAHNQLTNTDRYVDTVSPLASNKDIQETVAAVVVNALFEHV